MKFECEPFFSSRNVIEIIDQMICSCSSYYLQSISPGAVKTEIFKPEIMELIQNIPFLEPEDVSEACLYALRTRPHVQVSNKTTIIVRSKKYKHIHKFNSICLYLFLGSRTHNQASRRACMNLQTEIVVSIKCLKYYFIHELFRNYNFPNFFLL